MLNNIREPPKDKRRGHDHVSAIHSLFTSLISATEYHKAHFHFLPVFSATARPCLLSSGTWRKRGALYTSDGTPLLHGCHGLSFVYSVQAPTWTCKGWQYLKFSLLFFFIWNINAFITHGLELEIPHEAIRQEGLLPNALCTPLTFKVCIYYIGKFDHLLCVPAMFCLAMALRSFCSEAEQRSQKDRAEAI